MKVKVRRLKTKPCYKIARPIGMPMATFVEEDSPPTLAEYEVTDNPGGEITIEVKEELDLDMGLVNRWFLWIRGDESLADAINMAVCEKYGFFPLEILEINGIPITN